jgi:ppGpp synthetase/RelA/SpoT-type nucleotidyltranferase
VNRLSISAETEKSPSKTSVKRAGEVLRDFQNTQILIGREASEKYNSAYRILVNYRASHQYPLMKATNALRSAVSAENCTVEVSQRLKRIPTILDKLSRETEMDLSRMQDFGGCRAVLDNVDQVRRVQARLIRNHKRRTGKEPNIKDYISQPRESGYRGVHVVVVYDGRLVEVQLRTKVMHDWAIAVERLTGRTGIDLKSSKGPPEIQEYLSLASELMAVDEVEGTVDPDMLRRMTELREDALQFMSRDRHLREGD